MNVIVFVVLVCHAILLSKAYTKLENPDLLDGRKELRELDMGTLFVMQREFRQLRQEFVGNDTLLDGMATAQMEKDIVIERLEKAIGMKLPYWDYRIDAQLTNSADSSILLMDLCQYEDDRSNNSSQMDTAYEAESEVDQQILEIEQSCKNGALLQVLRQIFAFNNVTHTGCLRCETEISKRWLFCDPNIQECISKIVPNGNCTLFAHDPDCCYHSTCQEGRCGVEETATVVKNSATDKTHPEIPKNTTIAESPVTYSKHPDKPLKTFIPELETIKLSPAADLAPNTDSADALKTHALIEKEKAQLTKTVGIPESTPPMEPSKFEDLDNYWTNITTAENKYESEIPYGKNQRVLIQTEKNWNRKKSNKKRAEKARHGEKVEIDEVVIQKDPESGYSVPHHNSTFRKKKLSKYNYYRKNRKMKQQKKISKLPKSSAHLYGHDLPTFSKDPVEPSTIGQQLGKKIKFGVKRSKISSKKQRKAIDDKFYQFLLPTAAALIVPAQYVYFSITAIEGEPKRYNLLNRAATGCEITLTGANMPYGFTETIKGQLSQGTTSGIVRTLNPELFGPLVEFNITVTDRHGHSCSRRCLSSKGFYEPCEERPVRLWSHEFTSFSDPIEVYETQKSLLESQWTGRGYFRKRKRDFLLFTCDG